MQATPVFGRKRLTSKPQALRLRGNLAGLTMLELMITVAIIATIAAIAVPSWMRARERAQTTRMVNDLRKFAGSFELFNSESNKWPDERGPGLFPSVVAGTNDNSMDGIIRRISWEAPTVIGGQYDWDYNMNGVLAAVSVA